MASFQPAVGLPPLSATAAINHRPGAISRPELAGTSSFGSSTTNECRDARIKDPVPRKLKGQTNNLSGNFGVLQMELGRHESSLERDELAKRASERTELAAIKAYQSGHGLSSLKRFVRVPDTLNAWNSNHTLASVTQAHAPSVSPTATAQPLTPSNVKEEQARLLVLLRDLSASSVVEQICRALTYFGGVPGAAPPSDSIFPTSELANGSGAAFVGWIAEIFPKLSDKSTAAVETVQQSNATGPPPVASEPSDKVHATEFGVSPDLSAETTENVPAARIPDDVETLAGKRRRGRPKGSKASKARCDKGIKKGPLKGRKVLAACDPVSNFNLSQIRQEPQLSHGWLDAEQHQVLDVTGTINDNIFFPADSNAGFASDASKLESRQQAPVPKTDGTNLDKTGASHNAQPPESKKKRGRPKGSKNRSKPPFEDLTETASAKTVPTTVTPIPPPVVPAVSNAGHLEPSEKPGRKKMKAPSLHATITGRQGSSSVPVHGHDIAVESLNHQGEFELPNATDDIQHPSAPSTATSTLAATRNKRKRAKAPRPDDTLIDTLSSHGSMGASAVPPVANVGHAGQLSDQHDGKTAPTKKQRWAETTDSISSAKGSASPAPDIIENTTAAGFVQAVESSGIDGSIMPSLDPNSSSHGVFNTAAAFDALSAHLDQDTAASLTGQQQHNHDHDLASLLDQQMPQQHRPSLQQQPLIAREAAPLTPPFRSSEQLRTLTGTAHYHQQQLNHGQPAQRLQQFHPHQQASTHGTSSESSHNNAQAQVPTSLSSSFFGNQQLPRPNAPQPFYAQKRPSGNNHFGQLISQPLHQQQQQQHQKLQYSTNYQAQGQYSSQAQQQQQAFVPHRRNPSQAVDSSTSGLLNHANSHRSPHFAAQNTTAMRPGSGTYVSSTHSGTIGFNSSAYDQSRRQNTASSPGLGHTYGTSVTPSHTLGHQNQPSYMGSRQQNSQSTPHTHGVSSVGQGLQGFHGFDSPSLFDDISLEPAGNSNSLGLSSAATYGLGGVPRTSNSANAFGSTSSAALDTGLGANMRDRFYDVRR
ncbi:hypothetical protein SEPCBS57363_005801 [Sporothrix epigloea]|uniref:Hmg-i/hmg-y, DNA-binding protein n=1 Tax=Sporothrix epigloea TaxID=1892477 RepID=A0ABP0E1V5_9PEZI